jgi:Flp pilus assembly protein TadD
LNPRNVRFHYVLGVALHSSGETGRALEVLRRAHLEHPGNRELLLGLATISRDSGDLESAMGYARKLVELSPRDQGARQLLQGLQVRQ